MGYTSPIRREDVNEGQGPSPRIWAGIRPTAPIESPGVGVFSTDDFTNFGGAKSSTARRSGEWFTYETASTAADVAQIDAFGGVVRLKTDATTQREAYLQKNRENATGLILIKKDLNRQIAFEQRVRVSSAALGNQSLFVGLAAAETINNNFIAAAGNAVIDKDLVGFLVLTASGSMSVSSVYRKEGETLVTVDSAIHAFALNAWTTLGFVKPQGRDELRFVINNEIVSTLDLAAADNFPDDELLVETIGTRNHTTAIKQVDIDWSRAFSTRDR